MPRLLLPVVLAAAACRAAPELVGTDVPGEPLTGLDAGDVTAFERGKELFDRDFGPIDGLGPAYNQTRCSSCHDLPALGGGGVEMARKATLYDLREGCDVLAGSGGPLFQERITAAAATAGASAEAIPPAAAHRSDLNAPALFGSGLVASIPDGVLTAWEDPDDADGDGVSGRAVRTAEGVGRFGLKAEHATLRGFVAEALLGEMGLTSLEQPNDQPVGGAVVDDGVVDPEVDGPSVDALVAFVSGLAPVLPRRGPREGLGDEVAGAALFETVGCAACHRPFFEAGPDAPEALRGRSFSLYSDLLLHDLGDRAAGHCTAQASPTEWRTAPLAGLRHRTALFHDGSVESLIRAIERHGGEAARSAWAFGALAPTQREDLLAFLSTL